jgi:hypothetical protein
MKTAMEAVRPVNGLSAPSNHSRLSVDFSCSSCNSWFNRLQLGSRNFRSTCPSTDRIVSLNCAKFQLISPRFYFFLFRLVPCERFTTRKQTEANGTKVKKFRVFRVIRGLTAFSGRISPNCDKFWSWTSTPLRPLRERSLRVAALKNENSQLADVTVRAPVGVAVGFC